MASRKYRDLPELNPSSGLRLRCRRARSSTDEYVKVHCPQ
jgi:hypothetical protein